MRQHRQSLERRIAQAVPTGTYDGYPVRRWRLEFQFAPHYQTVSYGSCQQAEYESSRYALPSLLLQVESYRTQAVFTNHPQLERSTASLH